MVLLVGVLLAAACGDDDDTEATAGEDDTTTTTDAPDDGAGGDGPSITIRDFDFEDGVSVAAGEPLEVVNADGVAHTLTERDGAFDTGTVNGGSATELAVDQPGEYEVYCMIHPSMSGTLTVEG